ERSTEAHNTVVVNRKNQSQVWGGFRVAKRATTTIHVDQDGVYEASHDGYKKIGIRHKRKFVFEDNSFAIADELSNNGSGIFYLHLHPERKITSVKDRMAVIDDSISIVFHGIESIAVEEYKYADSYNRYTQAS